MRRLSISSVNTCVYLVKEIGEAKKNLFVTLSNELSFDLSFLRFFTFFVSSNVVVSLLRN